MRLLATLEARKACAIDTKYYNKVQGLIYNIIRDSPYKELHDKKNFKYFCFSNIFPGKEALEGEKKNIIISSPDRHFLSILKEGLSKMQVINIGEMQFSFAGIKEVKSRVQDNCVIKTATPIIIRIPQYRYAEYGISSKYTYVFWKPEHDFNAFLKQLSENIIKKYNEYHKSKIEEQPLFQQFMYDSSYPIHPIIDNIEQTFIGSYWKFIFSHLSKEQQKLLEFAIDCGFGELNSLGFGFVNVVK